MVTAVEGMEVMVTSPNQKEFWGYGRITKVEPLYMINDDDEPEYRILLTDNYPSEIILEDGRKTEGLECWWSPIPDSQSQSKSEGDQE